MSLTEHYIEGLRKSREWVEAELNTAKAEHDPPRVVRLTAQLADIDRTLHDYDNPEEMPGPGDLDPMVVYNLDRD